MEDVVRTGYDTLSYSYHDPRIISVTLHGQIGWWRFYLLPRVHAFLVWDADPALL